jgi:hypothetical protein
VDPGSVNTSIYRNNRLLGQGPLRGVRAFFGSPPSEGAAAVVHAATGAGEACSMLRRCHQVLM